MHTKKLTYNVSFYDINEVPPKVSIKIDSETVLSSRGDSLPISTQIDAIIEANAIGDPYVEMSLKEKGKYDVLSNVISLLSKEKLYNCVEGEMIIYSVIDVIKNIETTNPMQSVTLGSIIATLKQKFFVIKPPYSYD